MSSPVLSYKKPRKEDAESVPEQTRKVSRRKALQEFYHIQQQKAQEASGSGTTNETKDTTSELTNTTNETAQNTTKVANETSTDTPTDTELPDLSNQAAFEHYIKTTTINDILKLRNTVTNDLNSHELEKKSIIYDNYYELIKLNKTLQNLSNPAVPKDTKIVTGLNHLDDDKVTIDRKYISTSLNDLKEFFDKKAATYNDTFPNVISNLLSEFNDSQSTASVMAINETTEIIPDNIDKASLVAEINLLLDAKQLDESKRLQIKSKIDELVKKLNDQLFILQLYDIKETLK